MVKCNNRMLICFIVLISLGLVGCGRTEGSEEGTSSSGIKTDALEPRIPHLEEGVDVYALENEIFGILGPESVSVKTNRSSGSGILWKYDGSRVIVVTAGHLLSDVEEGELELWSGETLSFWAEEIFYSEEADLAAICVDYDEDLKMAKGGAGDYAVKNSPEIGDELWIIDSVYGAASGIGSCQVSAVDIFLEDYDAEMLLLYGVGKAGMSGCPIYDKDGGLVAMMSGMSEDGTTLAAVPAEKIMKFLETLDK